MEHPGTFISIEGLDGAGKSTAIEALSQAFGEVHVLREPGGTALSEILRAVLKGEPIPEVKPPSITPTARLLLQEASRKDPSGELEVFIETLATNNVPSFSGELDAELELLLFNAARAQLVEETLVPLLETGATVIADRFFDSTIAYQAYGRGLDVETVEQQCLAATSGLVPERTLLLRISPETRLQRVSSRGDLDRFEQAGDDFFLRVADGFDTLSQRFSNRFVVVDAEQTPEAVAQAVIKAVQDLLQS